MSIWLQPTASKPIQALLKYFGLPGLETFFYRETFRWAGLRFPKTHTEIVEMVADVPLQKWKTSVQLPPQQDKMWTHTHCQTPLDHSCDGSTSWPLCCRATENGSRCRRKYKVCQTEEQENCRQTTMQQSSGRSLCCMDVDAFLTILTSDVKNDAGSTCSKNTLTIQTQYENVCQYLTFHCLILNRDLHWPQYFLYFREPALQGY